MSGAADRSPEAVVSRQVRELLSGQEDVAA